MYVSQSLILILAIYCLKKQHFTLQSSPHLYSVDPIFEVSFTMFTNLEVEYKDSVMFKVKFFLCFYTRLGLLYKSVYAQINRHQERGKGEFQEEKNIFFKHRTLGS